MPVCYIYLRPRVRQRSHFAGRAFYIAIKNFFSTFRGGGVDPVNPALKYGPGCAGGLRGDIVDVQHVPRADRRV